MDATPNEEHPAAAPNAGRGSGPSAPIPIGRDRRYVVLAFIGAFALTAAFSSAALFHAVQIISSGGVVSGSDPFYSVLTRISWSADLVSVLAFYAIGSKVDFRRRFALLALATFAGALLGSVPGDVAITTSTSNGSIVGYSLASDPLSLSRLLVGSFSTSTIPFAGLGLAFLTDQVPRDGLPSRSALTFFAAAYVILFAYFINSGIISPLLAPVYNALSPPPSQLSFLQLEANPGAPFENYVGWAFSPVLLFVTFYLLGRRFNPTGRLRNFALACFGGAAAAYAIGVSLNAAYTYGVLGYQLPLTLNLALVQGAVEEGLFFIAFAVSAVSLGLARRMSSPPPQSEEEATAGPAVC